MASGDITRYVITVTFHEDSLTEINEYEEVNHLILLKNPGGKWIKRDLMG